jgi:hypothetical protein
MTHQELAGKLARYLPAGAENIIARWIIEYKVYFKITLPRNSVYGNYLCPQNGKGHIITINGNLNRYSFLVTTIHEFAHLFTWNVYKNTVKPHGKEWKEIYTKNLLPFLHGKYFPEDVARALHKHLSSPSASTCTDTDLLKILKKYDGIKETVFLEELSEGEIFEFYGKIFVKGKLKRTRFECPIHQGKSVYLISKIAEVKRLSNG